MVASTWLGDHQGRPSTPTNSLHKLHMARYQVLLTKQYNIYLESLIDRGGRCEAELVRRIAIAQNCMTHLDRNIWHSSISMSTEICLYSDKGHVSHGGCLRPVLPAPHISIHYSQHVTNVEVRRRTGCSPLSETIRSIRRLRLFGRIARAEPEMDHCRCLRTAINIAASTRLGMATRMPGSHLDPYC